MVNSGYSFNWFMKKNFTYIRACLYFQKSCRFQLRKHPATDAPLFAAGVNAARLRLPCGAVRRALRGDVYLLNPAHVARHLAQHLFPGRRFQLRQQRRQPGIHFIQFSHVSPSRLPPARPIPAPPQRWFYRPPSLPQCVLSVSDPC